MLKLLHAADLHLDAPFAALPPGRSAQRRAEQRTLPRRLAALAAERGADLVLLAGDLLDGGETAYETIRALRAALGDIPAPVVIAPGNHDFYGPRSPYAALPWPENVHIFRESALAALPLPALGCVVHGAAFTGPARDDDPLAGFAAPDDGRIHLGVLHGEAGGRGRYGPIALSSIGGSGLAYLALGHVHTRSGLRRAGETWWAYPGCAEGRGFDETGEKGALLVTLEGGEVREEFLPLAARRYEVLTVDVTGADPAAALLAALPGGREGDVLRVLLTGEAEGVDTDRLAALAAPRCCGVTVLDRTRPPRDLWERLGEDTLAGLFLREMRGRLEETADPARREVLELAVRFGLSALEGGEDCRP